MRYVIPFLLLAAPAMAHDTGEPHVHTVGSTIPLAPFLIGVAVLLIGAAALVAQRRNARVRK